MSMFPTFTRFARSLGETAGSALGLLSGRGAARLRHFDRGMFCRQLASMLTGGVALPQALAYLADEFAPRAAAGVNAVRQRVTDGQRLSEALGALPAAAFPPAWTAAVAAGERSGKLPEVLDMLASEGETVDEATRQARGLLVYPVVVLALAFWVVSIVLWKVIPVFSSLYAALRGRLPLGTRMLIRVESYLSTPVVLVGVAVVLYLLLLVFAPRLGLPLRQPIARLLLRAPVARQLWLSVVELRFARTLRILVDAGVPLPEALDRCEEVVGDSAAGRELMTAARRIREGKLPSVALASLGALAPAFVWFLSGSEGRGDFLEITAAMAEAAQEKLRTRIHLTMQVLEPVCIAFLGVVIGFVVVHVYWPMFRLPALVGN